MLPLDPIVSKRQRLSKQRAELTSSARWPDMRVSTTTTIEGLCVWMRLAMFLWKFGFPVPLQFQTSKGVQQVMRMWV